MNGSVSSRTALILHSCTYCTGSCSCYINLCWALAARAPANTWIPHQIPKKKGLCKVECLPNDGVNGCRFSTRCCDLASGICSHSATRAIMSSRTDARSRGLARSRCFVHPKDAQWEYRQIRQGFSTPNWKKKKSISLQTKVITGFRPQTFFFFFFFTQGSQYTFRQII